ncbi:MAG: hypothetical protein Q8P22_07645 [Chloroflexota bacterium]|nr:hypothetical protein [Chloroflexota bacterium]
MTAFSVVGGGGFYAIARYEREKLLPLELLDGTWLHFRQRVLIIEDRLELNSYSYAHSVSPDPDDEGAKVFMYHYSRDRSANPDRPQAHLHVNASHNGQALKRFHFPTMRITVQHLVAFLVIEHRVKCRLLRDELRGVLRDSFQESGKVVGLPPVEFP